MKGDFLFAILFPNQFLSIALIYKCQFSALKYVFEHITFLLGLINVMIR